MRVVLNKKTNRFSKKFKIIMGTVGGILFVIAVALFIFFNFYHVYEEKVVSPTCTVNGYTEKICVYCHKIERKNYTAALGHDYGDVEVISKASETTFGEKTQVCARCDDTKNFDIEPTADMKKFYIDGDVFDTDEDRVTSGKITYSYDGETVDSFAKLQYLDSNTNRYVKHDYSISFYSDEDFTKKKKLNLVGDAQSSTWCLYGDYYDFYNARAAVAAKLFQNIRELSDGGDTEFPEFAENYGVNESERALVFVNKTFVGVYSVYEPTTAKTLNMEDVDGSCAIVRANSFNNATAFKSTFDDEESTAWSILYTYNDEKKWVYNSLNTFADFVANSTDKEFKEKISNYLDVDGMIDYMLTVYFAGAGANTVDNFTLATYDGKKWTPSVYDMNYTFGLNSDGELSDLKKTLVPSKDGDEYDDDTSSLLWEKMLNNFYDEIRERYNSLKTTEFEASNIIELFEDVIDEVPESIYEKDKELYINVETDFDLSDTLTDYVASRRNVFDVFFE